MVNFDRWSQLLDKLHQVLPASFDLVDGSLILNIFSASGKFESRNGFVDIVVGG